uniref:MSP domain-containing protein n=1 Tax=Parascaris univalens TaxID=6257 RepID=A0A915BM38_PARUN
NNSNYTVEPNMGIVEVGDEVPLEITRSSGKPKADRLVILFEAIASGNNDYMSCFAPGAPKSEISGEFVVKLSAAE